MNLNKDDLEVGNQYEIKQKYHGDKPPYIMTFKSVGAANACFEGKTPTKNFHRTFILIDDIPKYVKPLSKKRI
ncbi:hypothetical protein [Nonlabens sp. Asnod3-H03]|uniref:hypothetical protein n=1 Tax=Nonlabens sp. Asnod3-H03 TaxID=3160580 RepID=UPI00386F5658